MTDLTPVFAGILQKHGKQLRPRTFSVDNLDDFLKEAYKIVRALPRVPTRLFPTR